MASSSCWLAIGKPSVALDGLANEGQGGQAEAVCKAVTVCELQAQQLLWSQVFVFPCVRVPRYGKGEKT